MGCAEKVASKSLEASAHRGHSGATEASEEQPSRGLTERRADKRDRVVDVDRAHREVGVVSGQVVARAETAARSRNAGFSARWSQEIAGRFIP